MRATRLIYKLHTGNKSYEERFRTLDLPTLKYRRLRGDMIETYKILSGKYDVSVSPVIPLVTDTVTRSNTLKIRNRRTHYDTRKYFFVIELQTFGIVYL